MKRVIVLVALVFMVIQWMVLSSPMELRAVYQQMLLSYDQTPYVWGGESHRGIDCSGLVRRGLIDALRQVGIKHLRLDLLWQSYALSLIDFHARDIMTNTRHFTFIKRIENLNQASLTELQPGDLAVLASGTHVMVYLGHNDWIEANGTEDKVIRVRLPEKKLQHFSKPVFIYRWKIFL